MNWSKHISKKYLREYWFNKITGESVWVKPPEVIEQERQEQKDMKQKEEERKKTLEDRVRKLFDEYGPKTNKNMNDNDNNNKYEMKIENGNGMSWTIEGKSHWTEEDYREELRNINQSLRDY